MYSRLPDIAFISESWLNTSITNNMLDPDNQYNIYRSDRIESRVGGGAVVLVRKRSRCGLVQIPDRCKNLIIISGCDIVCVDIYFKSVKYRFILVYRPPMLFLPKVDQDHEMQVLTQILSSLSATKDTTFILGDFNLPNIDWINLTAKHNGIDDVFMNCMSTLGMTQFITNPTRLSFSTDENILDLILSNDPSSVHINDPLPPISSSDHLLLVFDVFVPYSCSATSHPDPIEPASIQLSAYNWSQANFQSINSLLSMVDWHNIFGFNFDADSIWTQLKSVINPIIDLNVPKHLIPHNNKYKPRNYPKHIRTLLTRKAAIWRSLKNNKSDQLRSKYAQIVSDCKEAITKYDIDRETKILNTNNLGAFYKFVNRKLSNTSGIPPLTDPAGNLIISDYDKSNLLNSYFQSVFTTDNGVLPNFPSRLPPDSPSYINDFHITPSIISDILNNLKTHSAAGPDRIPPIFYKNTSNTITHPLSILYRTVIDIHQLPSEWKYSIVTPKFKKGVPSTPSNYRPIALTCTCCKILESIISSQFTDFFLSHKLLNKQQHGFLKRHSTSTNLLDSINDWSISLHNQSSTIVAYVDFQRAFDSLSHTKLIYKLTSYGISGNLLYWIQSFLTNRTQIVRVGNHLSNPCPVSSGVPQGSVLGPILFILFINDVTDSFHDTISAQPFADDIKIYTTLTHPSDYISFQNHLDLIHAWSSAWQLPISHSKCNTFAIGKRFQPINNHTFNISSIPLTSLQSIPDLGITIEITLTFNNHIQSIITRANQRAHLIHRCFLSKDTKSLIRAFKVYVRPLLEFDTPAWSPHEIGLINSIEGVQRSFTKRLPGLKDTPYADRLSILKLQSLEHRRLITDLVTCFNIIHDRCSLEFARFSTFSHNPSSRGHSMRLSIPLVKTNSAKYSFSSRVVQPWNSLPADAVTATNVKLFRVKLSKLNLSKFLTIPTFIQL